jgi:hypothetical protein
VRVVVPSYSADPDGDVTLPAAPRAFPVFGRIKLTSVPYTDFVTEMKIFCNVKY